MRVLSVVLLIFLEFCFVFNEREKAKIERPALNWGKEMRARLLKPLPHAVGNCILFEWEKEGEVLPRSHGDEAYFFLRKKYQENLRLRFRVESPRMRVAHSGAHTCLAGG